MAKPQIENGYTRVANEILDNIAKINLSPYESRVLWAIIRLTYGWHKKVARISLGQLSELTGIKRNKMSGIIKRLEKQLLIVVDRTVRSRLYISFQKDYELWCRKLNLNYALYRSLPESPCPICGEDNTHEKHHIIPKQWNGPNTKENIIKLCRPCHLLVHLWYSHSSFKNAQDLYNSFWRELDGSLYGSSFEVDLAPEQLNRLPVNLLSPIMHSKWGRRLPEECYVYGIKVSPVRGPLLLDVTPVRGPEPTPVRGMKPAPVRGPHKRNKEKKDRIPSSDKIKKDMARKRELLKQLKGES